MAIERREGETLGDLSSRNVRRMILEEAALRIERFALRASTRPMTAALMRRVAERYAKKEE